MVGLLALADAPPRLLLQAWVEAHGVVNLPSHSQEPPRQDTSNTDRATKRETGGDSHRHAHRETTDQTETETDRHRQRQSQTEPQRQ